jgi:3-oxoacid CoA-transferase subunit A
LKFEPVELFLDFIDQDRVDKSTEEWLSKIERKLTYEKWWFGHYHGNREYANAYMLYEEIREIGENICVQRIGRPIYKRDEIVMFSYDNGKEQVEECGWIRIVDAKGTFGQSREVSYDIMTPKKGLYKHILESEIMGFKEQ